MGGEMKESTADKVLWTIFNILLVLLAIYSWRGYVIEMHKYEPDQFNWCDKLFGITEVSHE
jgi:hypothetical protein